MHLFTGSAVQHAIYFPRPMPAETYFPGADEVPEGGIADVCMPDHGKMIFRCAIFIE